MQVMLLPTRFQPLEQQNGPLADEPNPPGHRIQLQLIYRKFPGNSSQINHAVSTKIVYLIFLKTQLIITSTGSLGQKGLGYWILPGRGCTGRRRPSPGLSEARVLLQRGPTWRHLSAEASYGTGLCLSFWTRCWARKQCERQFYSQTRGELSVPTFRFVSGAAPFWTNPEQSHDLRDRLYICGTNFT